MACVYDLVIALVVTAAVGNSAKIQPAWRNILKDPAFSRFIGQLTYNAASVDIGMSLSCAIEHDGILRDIGDFAKRLNFTSRFFTIRNGFCKTGRYCFEPYVVTDKAVVIFCGQRWMDVANTFVRRYSHHVVIFSDEFYASAYRHQTTISTGFEEGAYYNVSFSNDNHTLLTMGQETECLSCETSAVRAGKPLRITTQVPLRGRELRVYCLRPYICEHPTFGLLLDALGHKEANITTVPIDAASENKRHLAEAFFMHSVSALVHNPVPEVRDAVRAPEVVVPVYYDSFAYSVFVRRRHPLPKHVVLFQPFTWRVWAYLTTVMALCAVTLKLISWAYLRRRGRPNVNNGGDVAFIFVPLLLQQACRLPDVVSKLTTARLVLGLWALLAVVLSTAFRATLTSLLRDVPLEGRPMEFTNERDVHRQGYRCCRLTYAGDNIAFSLGNFTPVKRKRSNCISPDDQVQHMNSTHVVYLLHSPSIKSHEGYVMQLYQNDYAPLPQTMSPYLTGPSLRSNSRYRDAIMATIVQAFESGLFERELALDRYMKSYQAAQNEQSGGTTDHTLKFGDLNGCLLIGAYGLTSATLYLVAEAALKMMGIS
ncbi:hypothetical protein HPB49_020790 [Dermacentor silvarum]|uniref:Uncharacterized protein n=1 Tax=Dermacentor silvarum TaxID=543639 RepID=A0ACB8DG35_DERSI|nr:hypothetical protein HPB49_020790 [Dermacentor silvarum]